MQEAHRISAMHVDWTLDFGFWIVDCGLDWNYSTKRTYCGDAGSYATDPRKVAMWR